MIDAIYARQSVDKKDSLSIEGQIALCRRYAAPDALIFEDRGFSGKNTKRPAFTELMRAVEDGRVGRIVVYRLDRFSRSLADFSALWETLQKNGVAFQSVTEQFDTSGPMGRAMLHIVMTFAQLERETTAARVRDNYRHRVSLGAWPGGPAPYGFALVKSARGGKRVSSLVPDEHAETVRQIFAAYLEPETTLRGLARSLNEKGLHGPKRETWDNVTLSRILKNPVYVRADRAVYCHFLARGVQLMPPPERFDGAHACLLTGKRDRGGANASERVLSLAAHEGIVPSDVWLRAQDKLAGQPQLPRANAGKYSWLTGLMKCARCGYAVKINYLKRERRCRLVCSGRSNLSACDAEIGIDPRELEAHLAPEIQRLFDACPDGDALPEDGARAEAVLDIERKIARLVDALAGGGEAAVPYITARIGALHAERGRLLSRAPHAAPPRLDFAALTFEEKKLAAAGLIERIELEGERANVIWKA